MANGSDDGTLINMCYTTNGVLGIWFESTSIRNYFVNKYKNAIYDANNYTPNDDDDTKPLEIIFTSA